MIHTNSQNNELFMRMIFRRMKNEKGIKNYLNSLNTELFMRIIFRRMKNEKGMKDYLKLTVH